MPKNFYPDNMVKRKKNRSNGGTFLSFVVILVGLGLCVMLAMLFSNFITVGSFSFSNNNEMKKNGYTIYAVSIFQSTNFSSAGTSAASFQDKGAAGYIYFDNGIFHVLASGYKEKSDADKVVEKLISQGQSARLLTIKVSSTSLSGSFSQSEQTALNNALMCYSNCFDSLYDMSVALDTNVSTANEIKNQLSTLLSSTKETKTNFDKAFSSRLTEKLLEISLSLKDVADYIDGISTSADSLSSRLKYCYFQIIEENQSLKKVLEES